MICIVDNCRKPTKARGLCGVHYKRWYRYGDPLVCKKTPNGEALRYYETVVKTYRGRECLIWPYDRDSDGYARMMVKGKNRSVTRMVCEDAHGPPPGLKFDAAHSCGWGHGGCVTNEHLRWATRKENMADAREHGTIMGRRGRLEAPYGAVAG